MTEISLRDHLVLCKCFRGKVAVNIFREVAFIFYPIPKEARGAGHTVPLARGITYDPGQF